MTRFSGVFASKIIAAIEMANKTNGNESCQRMGLKDLWKGFKTISRISKWET